VEERRYVFGATVLIFEVVGVLPDIDTENRGAAAAEWTVLIRRGLDL